MRRPKVSYNDVVNWVARFSRRLPLPDGLAAPVMVLAIACTANGYRPALAASSPEEILFQASDLKIYRTLSRQGTPVVVLTNVDAEGNLLSGGDGSRGVSQAPPALVPPGSSGAEGPCGRPGPERSGDGGAPGRPSSGGNIRVVVNGDGRTTPVDGREVDVSTDGSGGTTVIININPQASPERETAVLPAPLAYPIVAIGGLVGAYRYPDHMHFLGYEPGTSSPSWFGGLGLNAGNGFGLKNGTPCGRGFDCMFGPHSEPR